MTLKRHIEQQQFVHSVKEKLPKWLKWVPCLINYLYSFTNWALIAFIIIFFFADIYAFLQYIIHIELFKVNTDTWLDMLYFSVVTFSTLGFGDITAIHPVSMGLVMFEVFLGYIMLGGLVTFLANWLGRK